MTNVVDLIFLSPRHFTITANGKITMASNKTGVKRFVNQTRLVVEGNRVKFGTHGHYM